MSVADLDMHHAADRTARARRIAWVGSGAAILALCAVMAFVFGSDNGLDGRGLVVLVVSGVALAVLAFAAMELLWRRAERTGRNTDSERHPGA